MKRYAYILVIINLALAPVHSFVGCSVSDSLGEMSLLLFIVTTILAMLTPRGTRGSLGPFFWGLLAFLLNLLGSH